ncbi:Hypothetical predicted protein [Mytilus galloprovincialis]|uniref:Uncharacterized protein n=1 Tax=Mytilus galloprovincialis TaxID=29158 RepID=A0A8B6CPS4_MYTGA|nr:Hypothetical predicted protein [Mytilus galloprovincialis]
MGLFSDSPFDGICVIVLIILIVALFIGVAFVSVYEKGTFSDGSWYFHYTDKDSIEKILISLVIRASLDTLKDAFFGIGSYFTKWSPWYKSKDDIAMNIFGNLAKQKLMAGKLDCCIAVFLKDSDVKNVSQNGRDIHLYPGDLLLSGLKYFVF